MRSSGPNFGVPQRGQTSPEGSAGSAGFGKAAFVGGGNAAFGAGGGNGFFAGFGDALLGAVGFAAALRPAATFFGSFLGIVMQAIPEHRSIRQPHQSPGTSTKPRPRSAVAAHPSSLSVRTSSLRRISIARVTPCSPPAASP